MTSWWLVVRHSPDYVDPQTGVVYPYPPHGVAISAYDDEERAKLYAQLSNGVNDRYEAIEVCRKAKP